jgi:hypothetical protein
MPHSVGTVARELLFSDWIRLISSQAISDARLDHQEGASREQSRHMEGDSSRDPLFRDSSRPR